MRLEEKGKPTFMEIFFQGCEIKLTKEGTAP
jgi:hypothetical protein